MRISALALLLCAACGPDFSARPDTSPPAGSRLYGVFEGKTPCDDCERIKFALTLHVNDSTGAASTYVMERIDVGKGNDRTVTQGDWSRQVTIPLDPAAKYYALAGSPAELGRFWAIGDNLLLMLDEDLQPRVGNAEHSYTLSRTQ
jgi:NlpE N-terminal domain